MVAGKIEVSGFHHVDGDYVRSDHDNLTANNLLQTGRQLGQLVDLQPVAERAKDPPWSLAREPATVERGPEPPLDERDILAAHPSPA